MKDQWITHYAQEITEGHLRGGAAENNIPFQLPGK
jgi:hypothetical protein